MVLRPLALLLLAVVGIGATAWGVLAIRYFNIGRDGLRIALALAFAVFCVLALGAFTHPRTRWWGVAAFALVFLLACAVFDGLPWAVPVSGFGDGTMALLVWWVHRRVQPSP